MLTLKKNLEYKDQLPPRLEKKKQHLISSLKENEETSHYSVTVSSTKTEDYFWINGGLKEWALLIECSNNDPFKPAIIALIYIINTNKIAVIRSENISLTTIDLTMMKLLSFHEYLIKCLDQFLVKYNRTTVVLRDARDGKDQSKLSKPLGNTYFYNELSKGKI